MSEPSMHLQAALRRCRGRCLLVDTCETPQILLLRFLDASEMRRRDGYSCVGRLPGRPTAFHNGPVAADRWVAAAVRPGVAAEPAASTEAVVATATIGKCQAKVPGATRTSGVAAVETLLSREAEVLLGDPGYRVEVDAVATDTVVHNLQGHGTTQEDLSRKWRLSSRMVALMRMQLMR